MASADARFSSLTRGQGRRDHRPASRARPSANNGAPSLVNRASQVIQIPERTHPIGMIGDEAPGLILRENFAPGADLALAKKAGRQGQLLDEGGVRFLGSELVEMARRDRATDIRCSRTQPREVCQGLKGRLRI